MAELRIINGSDAGRIIPLGTAPVVLGRSPGCDVVIPSTAVSRQHSRIEWRQGSYLIMDLDTRNGTFLNNQQLAAPTPLKGNDRIRICDFLCVFLDRSPASEEARSAEPLFQALSEGREEVGGKIQYQVSPGGSGEEECRRLRESLETNHVFLVRAEATSLPGTLGEGDPAVLKILGRGFHRVVVLNAAAGLEPDGTRFDLERFLRDAYQQMVQTFGLRACLESFHVENVIQILKDEPRSLFCFVNVQLIPAADLRLLRGFTQEAHQALFLCCGARDLAGEEAEAGLGEFNSSFSNTTFSVQDAGGPELPDLLAMSSRWHQPALDLDSLCRRIGEDLFQLFRQADRCFVILANANTDSLRPRLIKTRRPQDESTARFSKSIVRRCMETAQAFLGDDASRDDRIQHSQSIVDFRIRSVLCAPLCRADGKAFGVIQLDTQDRGKKFTQEDLKLLCGVAHQAGVALENARLLEEAVKEERLRRDLQLACNVQSSFLPASLPQVAGYDFFAYYEAAQQVGGDYYGFIPLPGGRVAVAVGDVAGKGISAALMMAKLSSDTRFCLLTEPEPGRAVARLNDLLYEMASKADRFVTLAAGVLDPARHEVTLVSAGHPSPLLYQPGNAEVSNAMPQNALGVPLGIMDSSTFDSCVIALQPGESLLLFTDGVSESMDVRANAFGMQGIVNALKNAGKISARPLVERLVRALKKHAAGRDPHDDFTVVALSRTT
jgi:serine phosphatase RsbU (regulator of sigma subunit)